SIEGGGQLADGDVTRALDALEVRPSVLGELIARREQKGVDLEPHLAQRPRNHEPIAAVVALPADHGDPRRPPEPGRGLGDGTAAGLHQVEGRHFLILDGPRIGGPHLLRVETGIQPLLHDRARLPAVRARAYAAIATAAAESREWVSEMVISLSPAASAATPCSRSVGGSPLTTSMSFRGTPRPSALITASFAAKRAAR